MRKLFLLFLPLIAWPLIAEVNEKNIAYTYYVANADPSRSLTVILNIATPLRHDGQIMYGHTTWSVKWNLLWVENPNGRCKLTKVVTELSGSIKLPKLTGETTTLRDQFDRFLSALRIHELGHYDIGKEAAGVIDRKIISLPEMSSCKELETTANGLGYAVVDEYKEKERRYDESTSYGRSQGAWLEK